jgi:hypothetical protein
MRSSPAILDRVELDLKQIEVVFNDELRSSAAPGVRWPAGGSRLLGSAGGHQGSSGTAACLPWPSGPRSWATRAGCRPPRRDGGSWAGRGRPCRWVGLPPGIPFRAADPDAVPGPIGPSGRPATKEEGGSATMLRSPCCVRYEQDDHADRPQVPAIVRLGRFCAPVPSPGAALTHRVNSGKLAGCAA